MMPKTSPIVTTNLIMNLDASNPSSYSGTGVNWFDISGNSNNAVLTNEPTFDSGNGGSILFDGTNDYAILPNINFTNEFTASGWIYITASGNESLIGNWQGTGSTDSWLVTSQGNNTMYFFTSNPANTVFGVVNDGGYSLNTWYHYTAVFNNGVQKIYRNGIEKGTSNVGYTSIYQNAKNLWIAHYSTAYLNGKIPQLLLYNRALTASEILQNFNATKSKFGL